MAANIVPQRDVDTGGSTLAAQGILPIHAAVDGIRRLAVGETLETQHHQCQAPGLDLYRAPLERLAIGQELIIVECAERGV